MRNHEDEIYEFEIYQKLTHETAVYPKEKGLEYLALGAANEAGEIAGAVKKYLRGDLTLYQMEEKILKEMGDTLWYLSELHNHLGYALSVTAAENIKKLADRQERGVLKGDGDVR